MNKIKRIFTDKRFIYGSGSAATLAGFIAVAVLINIIVGALSDKLTLKIDLTQNKIFSLSQQTEEIVRDITTPVSVILFQTAGAEDAETRELLNRYVNLNSNLTLRTEDPVKNPVSAQKYNAANASISVGSIVFDNGKKFKVVSPSDLRAYNAYTQQTDQFQAENKITSALMSLSKSADMTVAFSEGHGEERRGGAEQVLKDDGINVATVPTLTEGFAEEYDLFLVISPKTDFTAEEIESLDQYLKKGKNIQIYFDLQNPALPRLESYLEDSGVSVRSNLVLETERNKIVNNQAFCFTPTVKSHPITNAIVSNNMYVITWANREVRPLWDERNSVKIETLLQSSDGAMAQSTADTQEEPQRGPFGLAVLATRSYEDGKQSKAFVMGTSIFISDDLLTTNKDFFLGSVNWQIDNTEPLKISPKSLSSDKLEMTQQDLILWMLILVIFIPLLVLAFGLATWLRRRHL
ncbi:MAG: GldG family protein [Clostridiales bacterium]|jgi:ABC-type uncharacterized transport system involved in gliding motility auxiliary subunit|nr:GldG family protein [Clostridiales bacterium]